MAKTFSLKDELFNPKKVSGMADEIHAVYPRFQKKKFHTAVVKEFPKLELKERITWIREQLKEFLPSDYRRAVKILVASLPEENDPTKTDDDFGDFIHAPYAEFVAIYGCTKKDLKFSLNALHEMTRRFSAEDAIRYFINAFPKETMATLKKWTKDPNYHVRRLASEGTRPRLPWCQKIHIDYTDTLPILHALFADNTRYVTRSVANHMNDISKIDPTLAVSTLREWKKSKKQDSKEMEYIIRHSLRTLVKQGDTKALALLGYKSTPQVEIGKLQLAKKRIPLGEALQFSLPIIAKRKERLLIDYRITFAAPKGKKQDRQKVFKLTQIELSKGEKQLVKKTHALRKKMTTFTIYPGKHTLTIQINGNDVVKAPFHIL